MKYYKAKVKVITQDDKGRQKKNVEEYLVHAVSVTDAETEVTSVLETRIIKVIS